MLGVLADCQLIVPATGRSIEARDPGLRAHPIRACPGPLLRMQLSPYPRTCQSAPVTCLQKMSRMRCRPVVLCRVFVRPDYITETDFVCSVRRFAEKLHQAAASCSFLSCLNAQRCRRCTRGFLGQFFRCLIHVIAFVSVDCTSVAVAERWCLTLQHSLTRVETAIAYRTEPWYRGFEANRGYIEASSRPASR